MNALPSYAGALETTYMLLFPRMNDEEVVSFLLACKWVSPMIANQERLVNDGASIPLGRFLSESMAIVSAVRYAELYDEHPITAIPAQADYVQMAYKLARKVLQSDTKDARRYASLLSLPYMILVSDKEVARSFVTKENFAEQLDLVLEIMNRWRHIDLPKPLRQTVEQLTPIYYSGFLSVYLSPFTPESARAAVLHGAELVAQDRVVIDSVLGPCSLADAAAVIRGRSVMYNFQIDEGSKQLLELFDQADSLSIACARALDSDAYPEPWSAFQECFSYCTALGEYEASAGMMAIAAEMFQQEKYASTRSSWMDFMLASFDGSIRHDTIMNSQSASRHMYEFVRSYVHIKDSPFTEKQALFVILHLFKAQGVLHDTLQERCDLVQSASQLIGLHPVSEGMTKLLALVRADCAGDQKAVAKAAREFVEADFGDEYLEAQRYAYFDYFNQNAAQRNRGSLERFVALNFSLYGACHPNSVFAIQQALEWYSIDHRPEQIKKFLYDLVARYNQPDCQPLISWLPVYNSVHGYLSYDPSTKKILELDMQALFSGLKADDCRSIEDIEALISWKNGSYADFREAESNARESLLLLQSLLGNDEGKWLMQQAPAVRKIYYWSLLFTYNSLCGAFGGVGIERPDSLCRYARLMEQTLLKDSSLTQDFAAIVASRLADCAAGNNWRHKEFANLLNADTVASMSRREFDDYVEWYGGRMQDTATSIRLKWHLDDRDSLMRHFRPLLERQGFMMSQARIRGALDSYSKLLGQLTNWIPGAVLRDQLMSVLESIHERYPEYGVSSLNALAAMNTSTARSIILQDRYRAHAASGESYLEAIGLLNIVYSADQWETMDVLRFEALCDEVLATLVGAKLGTERETKAWQSLVRVGALMVLEHGNDAQVLRMVRVMVNGLEGIRGMGRLPDGSLESREYLLLTELLKARSKPKSLNPEMESSILSFMKDAFREGQDGQTILRGYMAATDLHTELRENNEILDWGLEHLSDWVWYDYLAKNDIQRSQTIEFNLMVFWKVVRAAIKGDNARDLTPLFTQTWTQVLWLQSRYYTGPEAVSELKPLGFDEALFRKLESAYWSYPEAYHEKANEFTVIAAIYDSLFADADTVGCSTSRTARSLAGLSAAVDKSIPTASLASLRREALQRYTDLSCATEPDSTKYGLMDSDLWLFFPQSTAILRFERDVETDSYRLDYLSERAHEVYKLGSIEEIESSWHEWAKAMGEGADFVQQKSVPSFWVPIVQAVAQDSTIKQFALIPDGVYFNVNPNILTLEPTGQVRVDVVVDLASYLLPKVPSNRIGPVVLVGGLDYGGERSQRFALAGTIRSDRGIAKGGGWLNLPGTEKEVRAIAERVSANKGVPELITGSDASRSRIQELAFPQAIHFATHGFVRQDSVKARSAGLVLSGANIDPDGEGSYNSEGYLYAEDIRELDLFACDLVVLSACRTALSSNGSGQGEIIKAFKKAGVSKVIASSWAVPDECTALLMDHFYEYYLTGISASEALAEAQRKVAIRYPNVRDWGAFMVYQ